MATMLPGGPLVVPMVPGMGYPSRAAWARSRAMKSRSGTCPFGRMFRPQETSVPLLAERFWTACGREKMRGATAPQVSQQAGSSRSSMVRRRVQVAPHAPHRNS
jgi:hypothetical protein